MVSFRTDLPLVADESTRFLPWVVAFLTFIATLALGGFTMLNDASRTITGTLETSLTVEVPILPSEKPEELEQRAQQAIDILKATHGVKSAHILSDETLAALVSPWLGDSLVNAQSAQSGLGQSGLGQSGLGESGRGESGLAATGLPFPKLIDVTLDDPTGFNFSALNARLQDAIGARADDHAIWRVRLNSFLGVLQFAALTVAGTVFAAAAFMIAFATRSGLAAHRPTLELLHLIGAQDYYIARQFQKRVFGLALLGGFPGALAAAALAYAATQSGVALEAAPGLSLDFFGSAGSLDEIIGAGGAAGQTGSADLEMSIERSVSSAFSPFLAVALAMLVALTPPVMALVSMFATRWTVLARLKSMD